MVQSSFPGDLCRGQTAGQLDLPQVHGIVAVESVPIA